MARTVIYGANKFSIEDDNLSVDQIKSSMSEIFAELANAGHEIRGNEIHFTVKAGTKGAGARTVFYGANKFTIEDEALTPEEIKRSLSEIFAELANATYETRGNEIHFAVKAGTKGARTVIYGANKFTIEDDNLSVDQIKGSMSEIFAELANAGHEVRGNEIHFTVKAGTKGTFTVVVKTDGTVYILR